MPNAITIKSLKKYFSSIRAVNDISFNLNRGEVLGFLGPNGAGKSTTMKMIAGFIEPTAGVVEVNGVNVLEHPLIIKKTIGYLPEGVPAYAEMTVRGFLNFIADIRQLNKYERDKRIAEVTTLVSINDVLDQTIETLSKGYKRRVGLAQCVLHDPDILIMDEPTDGLDPNQKHEVRTLIKNMSKNKAIIISTHILEEVDAVCSRAIIIAHGRLLFDGTPKELVCRSEQGNIDHAFRMITSSKNA